jgi:hypothetical protein
MKRTNIIWYILGGLVLIALGFVAGYALNGGFTRAAVGAGTMMPYARGLRGAAVPGMLMGGLRFGLGWLMMLIFWLGPVAGIVALIIVLARRPAAPVAPPVAPVEAAPAEPVEAVAKPSRKK